MKKLLFLFVFALTACQTTQPNGLIVPASGSDVGENATRVTRKNLDVAKWIQTGAAGGQIVYQCRELACPSPSRITTNLSQSPVIKPNLTALNTIAKVDVPRMIAENRASGKSTAKLLSNSVTTRRGYPTTVYEMESTRENGTKYYNVNSNIYAGNILIRVGSSSNDLNVARANAAAYIANIDIIQGEKTKAALAR